MCLTESVAPSGARHGQQLQLLSWAVILDMSGQMLQQCQKMQSYRKLGLPTQACSQLLKQHCSFWQLKVSEHLTQSRCVCRFLTGALEDVSKQSGLNQAFLGLIVLPIAGNACEHITAVFVSIKNKMDLAIGVALGSSIQIAVFVIPVTVIVGWIFHKPFFLDSFAPFPTLMLTFAVIHAYFVSSDGNSNWLMGVELIATYTLIAMLYLFLHMS